MVDAYGGPKGHFLIIQLVQISVINIDEGSCTHTHRSEQIRSP